MPAIIWLCPIFFRSSAERRQDLRAVHPRTPVCGAFRMHGAHILPKPAHFGYMAAICCRELALFPSEAPSGTHEAKKLPRIAARKRTTAKYCHGRQPENASRRYLATVGRRWNAFRERSAIDERPKKAPRRNDATTCPSRTHGVDMLPRQGAPGICGRDMLPLPVRAALAHCRSEGAGGARGNHRPLRRDWGICVALVHGAHVAVFPGSGGTTQPARCRVRLGALIAGAWRLSQRPHRRGARPFSAD